MCIETYGARQLTANEQPAYCTVATAFPTARHCTVSVQFCTRDASFTVLVRPVSVLYIFDVHDFDYAALESQGDFIGDFGGFIGIGGCHYQ